ncbi:DUF4190 domain-containing protein [Verrucomicrobiales bacterium BCK34]|nr:DUF4190 domain-containing protein [Verrucomicrobiales bacterium BCK34]
MENPPKNIGAANNLALASLLLSSAFLFVGPLGSIPGLICGYLALREFRLSNVEQGQGMAKAGIVVGWIGLVIAVVTLCVVLKWRADYQERLDELLRL